MLPFAAIVGDGGGDRLSAKRRAVQPGQAIEATRAALFAGNALSHPNWLTGESFVSGRRIPRSREEAGL